MVTVTALDDFNIIPTGIMPPRFSPDPANNDPCAQINLVNDNLVEQDEYFIVMLSGGNEAIDILVNTAQVIITDDDGIILAIVGGKPLHKVHSNNNIIMLLSAY